MASPTKTLFLTGANSGVGLATTRLLLSKGWNVFATARSPDAAVELQALLLGSPEAGGRLAIHPIDLFDPATFQPAVDAAVARFGIVDVLLNNAGFGQTGLFEQLGMEDWRKQFQVNVFGQIELTNLFLTHFHATSTPSRPRTILFTSSGAAHFSLPLMGAYSASKAALESLVEAMHHELSASTSSTITAKIIVPYGGITTTNFASPSSATPLLAQLFAPDPNSSVNTDEDEKKKQEKLRERYTPLATKVAALFSSWSSKSMPTTAPAETVWRAATDGRADQLRYFVGPRDGGPALKRRLRVDEGVGETPDGVDGEYVGFMRGLWA